MLPLLLTRLSRSRLVDAHQDYLSTQHPAGARARALARRGSLWASSQTSRDHEKTMNPYSY